ncbi:MAG: hypothetical protein ABH950_01330 [Candidatus Altiarchaeota archaeon]
MDPRNWDNIFILPLSNLIPHENVSYIFDYKKSRYYRKTGLAPPPMLVTRFPKACGNLAGNLEEEKLIVLDGMHRRHLFSHEGLSHAPVVVVDYGEVELVGWSGLIEKEGLFVEDLVPVLNKVVNRLKKGEFFDYSQEKIDFSHLSVELGKDNLDEIRSGLSPKKRSVLYGVSDQGYQTASIVSSQGDISFHGVSIVVKSVEKEIESRFNKPKARWDVIKSVFDDCAKEYLYSSTEVILLMRPLFTKDEVVETANRVDEKGADWLLPRKSTRHIFHAQFNPHHAEVKMEWLYPEFKDNKKSYGRMDAQKRTEILRKHLKTL